MPISASALKRAELRDLKILMRDLSPVHASHLKRIKSGNYSEK